MKTAAEYFTGILYTAREFYDASAGAFFAWDTKLPGLLDSTTEEDERRDELANQEIQRLLARVANIAKRRIEDRGRAPTVVGTEPTEPNVLIPAPTSAVPVITRAPMTPPRGVKR